MPSPSRLIPISAVPSLWFEPITNSTEQAYIPGSIGPSETVTLDVPIKVLILSNHTPPAHETSFLEQDVLAITAEMPWLNRALPNFGYTRSIAIQYPLEIQGYEVLQSLAQGSTNHFTLKVGLTYVLI